MTTLARASAQSFAPQIGLWLDLLQRPLRAAIRQIRIRNGRRALAALSDHTLKDIGLRRCDIDSVVQSLVDGEPDDSRKPRRVGR